MSGLCQSSYALARELARAQTARRWSENGDAHDFPKVTCWTHPDNADAYPRILQDEVFEMIAGNNVAGYRGIDLLRRQNETKSSLLGSCGSTR